jgi:ectoine hydroxylase-related dioxygenase (phytanoyl-CoA dioxygenase family)
MQTPPDIDSAFALGPDSISFFRENGFVKLDGVFEPDVFELYGHAISKKVRELNTQTKPFEERTIYEKAFLQIHNLWTKDDLIKKFVMGKRLARAASELLGCRGVRLYHDQALYKEAGGGITPWHCDQYYWPLSNDNCVTAWVPLQETPLEMGPLAFAPGSFKIKHGRNLEISGESEEKIKMTLRDFPVFEKPFALGEVSFHGGWTFHRAGANKSSRTREVMTIIYIDEEMKLAEPKNKDQKNDREWWCPGVEVGQTFASRLNPVIFS